MHITIKKTKAVPSDTPDKNSTQKKRSFLMPFENNGILKFTCLMVEE